MTWRWGPDWAAISDAFDAMVAGWNVFILPFLLPVVMAIDAYRAKHSPVAWARGRPGRAKVVRRIGWAHLFFVVWSTVLIAQEVGTYRAMGIFPSNPVTGFAGSLLAIVCDLPVGLGLLRLRYWARSGGAALSLVRAIIFGLWTFWELRYGAPFDLEHLPRLAATRLFVIFAFVALVLPGTGRLFGPRSNELFENPPPPTRNDRWLAVAAIGFLVVVASSTLVDVIGWALRTVAEASTVGLS